MKGDSTMNHYTANLTDINFNLASTPELTALHHTPLYQEYDLATMKSILEEVARLAEGPLAESYIPGDRDKPIFHPATYSVELPDDIKSAYHTLMDAGYYYLDLPVELGGTDAPVNLRWAVAELILGANPSLYLYMAGPLFANILQRIGTPEQAHVAQLMVDKLWGATMVLTEPDAGSDVGAGRSTATRQPDGTWHIKGTKRFITSGDHDLADNIIHFVLARPVGVEGAGGPGTKGLSLFLVPKTHFNWETGDLGERNGVYVTNVENKMGLNASATCEVIFGEHDIPAVGWLVGERHTGIHDMFLIIQWARMMVGTKSMAQLSAAYHTSLDFAKTRIQGSDLTKAADKTAPKVTIINHPDVRRMLLQQKAYAEGLRALVHYTAAWQARHRHVAETGDDPDGLTAEQIHGLIDLLLPIVKGAGSERAAETLMLSMQVLGGSGYLKDYPIELEIRDQAIDKLYEGVTHQQALDLIVRKIAKDRMQAYTLLRERITLDLAEPATFPEYGTMKEAVQEAWGNLDEMTNILIQWMMSSQTGTSDDIYKMGENANQYLLSFGDAIIGWLLVRQARIAATMDNLPEEYIIGKKETAKYYIRTVLPRLNSDKTILLEGNTTTIMGIPENAF